MRELELQVRELLAAVQQERRAKLDAGRVDTVFKVGDQVLLRTKELLDAVDIGKLLLRWEGPFTITACPSPNAYTLALQRKMRCRLSVQPDGERGPDQNPSTRGPTTPRSGSCVGPGAGGRA